VVEKQAEVKFNEAVQVVKDKIGLREEIPWYKMTLALTGVYGLVTLLTLFSKADFLNVSTYRKRLTLPCSLQFVQLPLKCC